MYRYKPSFQGSFAVNLSLPRKIYATIPCPGAGAARSGGASARSATSVAAAAADAAGSEENFSGRADAKMKHDMTMT